MRQHAVAWAGLLLAAAVAGCNTNPGQGSNLNVEYTAPQSIELATPFGTIRLNFAKEKERVAASTAQLAKPPAGAKDPLLFREFDFATGPLPEGCSRFEDGQYARFVFPKDGAPLEGIEKRVESLKRDTGSPDEAVIALAIYQARAFRSLCGPETLAKLKPGSRINGWTLNEKAVELYKARGQEAVDVTPKIIIIALDKNAFGGRLKPTPINVLLSKFRFEVPPNSDSIAFDPKTGATILAYSMDYQNVTIGDVTRNAMAGGFTRIFVGQRYIYLIEFSTNTAGISENKWNSYQDYANSFRYVGEATGR